MHKFLSSHFEKIIAGTREARCASYHRNCRGCFKASQNFTEGHASFEDLHIAFSE